MKHFIYTLLLCCIIVTTVSAQTTTSFLTLGEGNSIGDGTFIGAASYSTQPCYTKSFALEHHYFGYINSSINFFRGGDVTGGFLTFNTNDNSERMRINASGNVGIGTTNPLYKLSINGILGAGNNTRGDGGYGGIDFTDNGIGYSQAAKIYTFRSLSSGEYYGFTNDYDGAGAQLSIIAKQSSGNITFYTGDPATMKMKITSSGNVGIGTTNPAYKLDVLGTIRAKEVLVNLVGGADFVFEKGYKLLPIEHVANYVQENKHLPDIPSATEMVKNGVSMGDMQVKLLQKVEELTLYAIQQDKSKKELERKYNALLEKVEMLTKQIEKK